jgi:hypothetical protein
LFESKNSIAVMPIVWLPVANSGGLYFPFPPKLPQQWLKQLTIRVTLWEIQCKKLTTELKKILLNDNNDDEKGDDDSGDSKDSDDDEKGDDDDEKGDDDGGDSLKDTVKKILS